VTPSWLESCDSVRTGSRVGFDVEERVVGVMHHRCPSLPTDPETGPSTPMTAREERGLC